MDLIITILPVVTKDIPISPRFTPYDFLSRCRFSTLTTRQPMVEFYLLTFPCFPLRKKEHKSYFGKNRTHDFRTSRCAGFLLDHSGDEYYRQYSQMFIINRINVEGQIRRIFTVFSGHFYCMRGPLLVELTGDDNNSTTRAVAVIRMSPEEYVWPSHINTRICM